MNDETILAANRVSNMPEPFVPSDQENCSECLVPVWRAHTSPKEARIVCLECFEQKYASEIRASDSQVLITPEQANEVAEHLGAEHPDLCKVIENLTESLRLLRRDEPQSFFGHPVETLYERLEAALASFYRAKVESTSPPPENGS